MIRMTGSSREKSIASSVVIFGGSVEAQAAEGAPVAGGDGYVGFVVPAGGTSTFF